MSETETKPEAVDSTPEKPECATCKHWHSQLEHSLVSGHCRRYPPQVVSSQEFLWPVLSHDSSCGEYSRCAVRVARMQEGVKQHLDEEQRLTQLAHELYEKAQRGELDQAPVQHQPVAPAIDKLTGPSLPVLQSQQPQHPQAQGVKPAAKTPFAPTLTVERMRALQAGRGK